MTQAVLREFIQKIYGQYLSSNQMMLKKNLKAMMIMSYLNSTKSIVYIQIGMKITKRDLKEISRLKNSCTQTLKTFNALTQYVMFTVKMNLRITKPFT